MLGEIRMIGSSRRLILGILGMLTGVVMAYTGREGVFPPFTFLAFATLIWLLARGIRMARRAW